MVTITDNPASGTYRARTSIQTMGTVTVVGFAEFLAGMEIVLNPGFAALSGSDFLARIQACDPCSVSPLVTDLETIQRSNHISFINLNEEQVLPAVIPVDLQVFPNPFDERFTITFETTEPGAVQILLIDITGRLAHSIFEAPELEAGLHKIEIDGSQLPSGIYDCRLVNPQGIQQAKLVKTSR